MKIEETKKEEDDKSKVQVKIHDPSGGVWAFRLKHNTSLGKVFSEYTKRTGGSQSKLRFSYLGRPLQPEDTPDSLNMEDGAKIEVFPSQVGG
ncbi:small ubiquitin-related modifier [Nematocida sp. LUAm3]|nr:small ubiquitin-related modifier [Nematocida sp. LUAm3]KAI5175286.1 small ubiquitin-related modifier [Nematocida sp. LUAm2]KAI5177607.1 small ubiquitin-related modifier [Nematocida sp. LUAm1]